MDYYFFFYISEKYLQFRKKLAFKLKVLNSLTFLFKLMYIVQRYVHNIEKNRKNSACTCVIFLIGKFLNFMAVFSKKNKLYKVCIQLSV